MREEEDRGEEGKGKGWRGAGIDDKGRGGGVDSDAQLEQGRRWLRRVLSRISDWG